MRFLRPEFLYFLPLALLPVLIHLLSRKKAVLYIFPSVRLLKKDALSKTTDFNLLNLLLLIMRVLALAMLIFYFADPSFVFGKKEAAAGGTAIFVDHSYSMNRGRGASTLWEEARFAAGELVRAMGEEKPSVFLFNNGFSFQGRGEEAVRALADKGKPTAASASFSDALSEFIQQNRDIKRLFILSDFAPSTFEAPVGIPGDVRLLCLALGEDANNFFVRSISIYDRHITVFPALLPAGKAEYFISALSSGERFNSVSGSGQSVAVTVPEEYSSGRIEIDNDDSLPDDNVFFYSRPVREKTLLPLLRGVGSRLDRDGAYFIRRIAERSSFFSVEVTVDPSAFAARLGPARAAIMTNPASVPPALAADLRRWVAAGGLLMIFPGDGTPVEELNRDLAGLLPARMYPVREQALEGISSLGIPWAGDEFSAEHYDRLSISGFFPLRAREDALKLIESGGETIATAVRFGEGAVILFAIPADMSFSNLPVVAGFPPFFLKSLEYFVYERKEFRRNYFVGERVSLPAGASLSFGGAAMELRPGPDGALFSAALEEPGLYDLSGSVDGRIAVNLVRGAENDLSVMPASELRKLFPGADIFRLRNPEAEIAHILRGKNLSSAVLLIFVMLLCAELALAHKLRNE